MQITVESVFTQSSELCDDLVTYVDMRQKLKRLVLFATLSGAMYGATMGLYHSKGLAAVSAIKVPMLFLLTLGICLPSLHFVGLLLGSPVRFGQTVVVLLTAICQTSILLAAFAPISLFFLVTGSEYAFLLIMHVGIFAFCGAAGLRAVHKNLQGVQMAANKEAWNVPGDRLLLIWMMLYMFVGTQMAFNLAPFIKSDGPITLFNALEGNFYSYLRNVISESLHR
jgi:hypothetical protein